MTDDPVSEKAEKVERRIFKLWICDNPECRDQAEAPPGERCEVCETGTVQVVDVVEVSPTHSPRLGEAAARPHIRIEWDPEHEQYVVSDDGGEFARGDQWWLLRDYVDDLIDGPGTVASGSLRERTLAALTNQDPQR